MKNGYQRYLAFRREDDRFYEQAVAKSQITEYDKSVIIGLFRQGNSLRDIARVVKIAFQQVELIYNEYFAKLEREQEINQPPPKHITQ